MSKVYVEAREGAYRIGGTRVSLDSLVYAYRLGASPESIQRAITSVEETGSDDSPFRAKGRCLDFLVVNY